MVIHQRTPSAPSTSGSVLQKHVSSAGSLAAAARGKKKSTLPTKSPHQSPSPASAASAAAASGKSPMRTVPLVASGLPIKSPSQKACKLCEYESECAAVASIKADLARQESKEEAPEMPDPLRSPAEADCGDCIKHKEQVRKNRKAASEALHNDRLAATRLRLGISPDSVALAVSASRKTSVQSRPASNEDDDSARGKSALLSSPASAPGLRGLKRKSTAPATNQDNDCVVVEPAAKRARSNPTPPASLAAASKSSSLPLSSTATGRNTPTNKGVSCKRCLTVKMYNVGVECEFDHCATCKSMTDEQVVRLGIWVVLALCTLRLCFVLIRLLCRVNSSKRTPRFFDRILPPRAS
jgi:hypothetical protein